LKKNVEERERRKERERKGGRKRHEPAFKRNILTNIQRERIHTNIQRERERK
jgi:hypothetical protein